MSSSPSGAKRSSTSQSNLFYLSQRFTVIMPPQVGNLHLLFFGTGNHPTIKLKENYPNDSFIFSSADIGDATAL